VIVSKYNEVGSGVECVDFIHGKMARRLDEWPKAERIDRRSRRTSGAAESVLRRRHRRHDAITLTKALRCAAAGSGHTGFRHFPSYFNVRIVPEGAT